MLTHYLFVKEENFPLAHMASQIIELDRLVAKY